MTAQLTPIVAPQREQLRIAAAKACTHPVMPAEARQAIAQLVAVVDELATAIDFLRVDVLQLRAASSSSSSS